MISGDVAGVVDVIAFRPPGRYLDGGPESEMSLSLMTIPVESP